MSKLGLLVLRQAGMPLLDKVLNRIKTVSSLRIKGIFGIKWAEEECRSKIEKIYKHITDKLILDSIEQIQGNEMIASIIRFSARPIKNELP